MPLPLTVSCFSKIQIGFTFLVPAHCFSKIQIGFTFLVPAHPGSHGQRVVKWLCVVGRQEGHPACKKLRGWVLASCVGETEASARLAEFRRLLTQLPLINYCTLRTLLRHLARSVQCVMYISLVHRLQSVTLSLCHFACSRLHCCIICWMSCATIYCVGFDEFYLPCVSSGRKAPLIRFLTSALVYIICFPTYPFFFTFSYLSPPFLSFPGLML